MIPRAFTAIVRLVRARITHWTREWVRPVGGPAGRFRRRWVLLVAAGGVLISTLALPHKFDVATRGFCMSKLAPSGVSDLCAAIHVPGVPTRRERLAWKALPNGDCSALRGFRETFPHSPHLAEVRSRLADSHFILSTGWTMNVTLRESYAREGAPLPSERAAFDDAIFRAKAKAIDMCAPADDQAQLVDAIITKTHRSCRQTSAGHICALDFTAQCRVRTHAPIETCS